MSKRILIMDAADNVGVALEDIAKGDICTDGTAEITALEDIEFCHKIALVSIRKGDDVRKYGQKIGYATEDIQKGQWLHRHNLVSERGR